MRQTIENRVDHSSDSQHWTLHGLAVQKEVQLHMVIADSLGGGKG